MGVSSSESESDTARLQVRFRLRLPTQSVKHGFSSDTEKPNILLSLVGDAVRCTPESAILDPLVDGKGDDDDDDEARCPSVTKPLTPATSGDYDVEFSIGPASIEAWLYYRRCWAHWDR